MNQDESEHNPADQSLILSMVLGWLFPGLGHVYMRKFRRGIISGTGIVLILLTGFFLCNWTYVTPDQFPFYMHCKYGSGLLMFILRTFTESAKINFSRPFHYFEIGVLFISVGGLLNAITVLNLIDVKAGRKLLLEPETEDRTDSENE